jgi:hypothetical protein
MHPDRLGLPPGAQLAPAILEVADQLLLLGVHRDRRLAGGLECLHRGVDVLELGIAVGVAGALARLAVRLQAEAQAVQQPADQLLSRGEALLGQRRRQVALAPADPPARNTASTPPRPAARASLAANRRRPRSSRNGAIASKRALMAAVSITASG